MKMFCKVFISRPEKKSIFIFLPPNLYPTKLFTGFSVTIFYLRQVFLLQYLFLSFRKSREGAYHVSYTEEKLKLSIIITICIISRGQLT